MKKLNSKVDNDTRRHFKILSGSPINKQKPSALQGIISIYAGHKMQCPPPLESANYLE